MFIVNELNRKKTLFVLSAFLIYVFQANGPNDFFFRRKTTVTYEDLLNLLVMKMKKMRVEGFEEKGLLCQE